MLVNVRLHDMMKKYSIFLENLCFPPFSKLMEAARCTNESIPKASRSSFVILPISVVRPASMITVVENSMEAKSSS